MSAEAVPLPGARHPHLALPGPEVVPRMVTSSLLDSSPTIGPGRRGEVVLFAVDGVSWRVLEDACASADVRVPYRSTFPSTSLVSWLAAVGLAQGEHSVVGPVFAVRPGITGNLIADQEVGWDGVNLGRPQLPGPQAGRTMFEALSVHGLSSELLVGDFLGINESWLSLLTRGATRIDPSRSLDAIRLFPGALVRSAVDDLYARQCTGSAAVRWVYVNFDDRIHRTGYDPEVFAALAGIAATAECLASDGYTTLVHSDHGHIRTVTCDADQSVWAELDRPEYCTTPAGGAGRVRWLYPRRGKGQQAADRLRDAFGDDVAVFVRDSQPWHDFCKLWGNAYLTGDAVGELVVVALSDRFPVPDPQYGFEHGSICTDEMTTGVAVWTGA